MNWWEWVFSGIGVAFITGLFSFMRYYKKKFGRKDKEKNDISDLEDLPIDKIINGDINVVNIGVLNTGTAYIEAKRTKKRTVLLGVVFIVVMIFATLLTLYLKIHITSNSANTQTYLLDGQLAYEKKEFDKSIESYYMVANQDEDIQKKAIALNNIAYMFSMGLGMDKDLEKAKENYIKAARLGYDLATKNLAALYIKHPFLANTFEEFLVTLKNAYEIGDEQTIRFVADLINHQNDAGRDISENEIRELARNFFGLSIQSQKDTLNNSCVWVYQKTIDLDSTTKVFESDFEKVIYISSSETSSFTHKYSYNQYYKEFNFSDVDEFPEEIYISNIYQE